MLVVLTETYCNKVNIQITQRDDFIQTCKLHLFFVRADNGLTVRNVCTKPTVGMREFKQRSVYTSKFWTFCGGEYPYCDSTGCQTLLCIAMELDEAGFRERLCPLTRPLKSYVITLQNTTWSVKNSFEIVHWSDLLWEFGDRWAVGL